MAAQAAALAQPKAEFYRYLWFHGGPIIAIPTSLYMLAESLAGR